MPVVNEARWGLAVARGALWGSAILIAIPGSVGIIYVLPVLAEALSGGNIGTSLTVLAVVSITAAALSTLAVLGWCAQRVSVSDEGFAPRFRPLRKIGRSYWIPWEEVLKVEQESRAGVTSYLVYHNSGKTFLLSTATFRDVRMVEGIVERAMVEITAKGPPEAKPSRFAW